MKKLLLCLSLLSSTAFAQMPYISNNTAESYERVSSGDITCESRQAHSTLNTGYYSSNSEYSQMNTNNDKGVYVSLSVPLTNKNKQTSCQGLYNTALEKEKLRVKQLEMQVETLKSRQLFAE